MSFFLDENTVMVSTDFGKNTMTSSGYASQVKLWKRGTLMKNANLIYEGRRYRCWLFRLCDER